MRLIKDILIYVDKECIDDFNMAVQIEGIDIPKVQTFSANGPEKFAILAENITPFLKPVINVIKHLIRVHKKRVMFEYQRKDGSYIKNNLDSYSKDDAIEILNEAVNLSIRISDNDRQ